MTLTSTAEAEYTIKLNTTFADGHVEHYAGTEGNYNLTAGTGTPRWHGNWSNTLEFGDAGSFSATAYYTSGYNLSAEDQGGVAGDCGLDGGLQACNVKSFIDVDLTGAVNVGSRFTLYANVLNAFNAHAPLDTATYGGYLYNPVVAESGIIGRSFRVGVRVKM
jgi:iron complex outermembrane receptor protein